MNHYQNHTETPASQSRSNSSCYIKQQEPTCNSRPNYARNTKNLNQTKKIPNQLSSESDNFIRGTSKASICLFIALFNFLSFESSWNASPVVLLTYLFNVNHNYSNDVFILTLFVIAEISVQYKWEIFSRLDNYVKEKRSCLTSLKRGKNMCFY